MLKGWPLVPRTTGIVVIGAAGKARADARRSGGGGRFPKRTHRGLDSGGLRSGPGVDPGAVGLELGLDFAELFQEPL